MKILDIPAEAKFGKVIPKKEFDAFTNTKQKKLFTDLVLRITWQYKISKKTVNLGYDTIDELQVFVIELKERERIKRVLEIIDKAILYHIVFVVRFNGESYISTAAKHIQQGDIDRSIVDHTFDSDWYDDELLPFHIPLKESIDNSYKQLCIQLCDRAIASDISLSDLVEQEIVIKKLKHEIKQLKSKVSKCKQFNKKVELNMELKRVEERLDRYYALHLL